MIEAVQVRPFGVSDIAALRWLMLGLAEFEGYADAFAVSEADLAAHGLGEAPRFRAFVADGGDEGLLGMAVTYVIPWTFDFRPTLVLKEMFVAEPARARGVGRALFAAVAAEAGRMGASRINWTVLPHNTAAQAFYRAQGGRPDVEWQPWTLELPRPAQAERGA
ncbi:GNAT family N-acetyltransferase [Phenylobacterium sp.]|jgi:GNAT superfamily N-acetyltransferase|uniref:GNAT family N-acetyltransferase n=1 Tax=Phenylobacterium sp. TaxID=1871053 RepID=UPI002F405D95